MKILPLIAAGALALGITATARPAEAAQPTLNLFIWSSYITESIIDGFELGIALVIGFHDLAVALFFEALDQVGIDIIRPDEEV